MDKHKDLMDVFVQAAMATLEGEMATPARPGCLYEQPAGPFFTDVRIMMLWGDDRARGMALYAMSRLTAMNLVARLLRQPPRELDFAVQGGIGQLGGLIAGRARRRAAETGQEVSISQPALLVGDSPFVTMPQLHHWLVPVHTDLGEVQVHLAAGMVRQRGMRREA